ncbi:hypothetical protein [Arthrobacter sp. 9MFCol3.1]|uniref:hypothetical protein n=1 Tax=Arthrobacter sp. 9MFCol3.1 TaxID=1150398 RepID=UPI0012DED213|nr:hypothetical protein [Arthrobacter sp. 9MFCol3.1]
MAESNAQKLEKAKPVVLDSIVKGVSTNQSQAVQRLANAYALLEGTVGLISGPEKRPNGSPGSTKPRPCGP